MQEFMMGESSSESVKNEDLTPMTPMCVYSDPYVYYAFIAYPG